MDIQALNCQRAECAARIEALANIGPGGDPEENKLMAIAMSRARAKYEAAEAAFQKAAKEQRRG